MAPVEIGWVVQRCSLIADLSTGHGGEPLFASGRRAALGASVVCYRLHTA